MAAKGGERAPPGNGRSDAEVLLAVVLETAAVFFKMRAVGRSLGGTTSWGGGSWGLLRSLVLEGPQTVPQLAASRPVARQRIQLIANELAGEGLVEFADNPAHRRSRLVRITAKGEGHYHEVRERLLTACEGMARTMDADELRICEKVMGEFAHRLADYLEKHPDLA